MTDDDKTQKGDARLLRAIQGGAAAPPLLDSPDPDALSDDWVAGWQACRETIRADLAVAFSRGETCARESVQAAGSRMLGLSILLTFALIAGFVLGVALF